MANVQIGFTAASKTFPFQIPPGRVQPLTAIPRARLTFTVVAGVITAKIATNTTSLSVSITLPPNFAYTIEWASVNVSFPTSTTDADNYDDIGAFTFQQTDLGTFARVNMIAPGIFGVSANAGSSKIWEPDNAYGGPLYSLDGLPVLVTLDVNDNDAGATVVGTLGSIVTVLQYDLRQVFNYPMNFPLPVTSRGT